MLKGIRGACVYGPADPAKVEARVPTVSFTLEGHTPEQIANYLSERSIYVWNGNFYALAVTQRLGLEETGGLVRVGATHYNTIDEINRFGGALRAIALRNQALLKADRQRGVLPGRSRAE